MPAIALTDGVLSLAVQSWAPKPGDELDVTIDGGLQIVLGFYADPTMISFEPKSLGALGELAKLFALPAVTPPKRVVVALRARRAELALVNHDVVDTIMAWDLGVPLGAGELALRIDLANRRLELRERTPDALVTFARWLTGTLPESPRMRGMRLQRAKDFAAARTALEEASTLDPSDATVLLSLAQVSRQLGDHAAALAQYDAVLALPSSDDLHTRALRGRGTALEQLDRPEDAIDNINTIIDRGLDTGTGPLLWRARLLVGLGHAQAALADADHVLARDGHGQQIAHEIRAKALAILARHDEAKAAAAEARSLDGTTAAAFNSYGAKPPR